MQHCTDLVARSSSEQGVTASREPLDTNYDMDSNGCMCGPCLLLCLCVGPVYEFMIKSESFVNFSMYGMSVCSVIFFLLGSYAYDCIAWVSV